MRKCPLVVWIAALILSLYTIVFFAIFLYQAFSFYGHLQAVDGPIFSTIRMVVGLLFGLLGLFTAVGLVKGKRWSRWGYLLPIMVVPILVASDVYSGAKGGFKIDELVDTGDYLAFFAVVVFFYIPLFVGLALIMLGTKANAFFADISAEVPSGIAEPPPPPIFEDLR